MFSQSVNVGYYWKLTSRDFLPSKLTEYNNSGRCIGHIDSSSWKTHVLRRLTKIALIKQPIVLLHISLLAIVCVYFSMMAGLWKKNWLFSLWLLGGYVYDVYYKQQCRSGNNCYYNLQWSPQQQLSTLRLQQCVQPPKIYVCVELILACVSSFCASIFCSSI